MNYRTRACSGLGLLAAVAVFGTVWIWNHPGPDRASSDEAPAGTPEPEPQPSKPPPEQEGLARAAAEPFVSAEATHSVDGVLRATLEVRYADSVIRGSHVHLRSYNGRLVGSTLRARPGDVLKIRLANRLPQVPEPPVHGV